MKGNNKGFYKYIKSKKTTENISLMLNGAEDLVKNYMEKPEVLNSFFVSAFKIKNGLQESKAIDIRGKVWNKEKLPSVDKNLLREQFNRLDASKSLGSDRLHP